MQNIEYVPAPERVFVYYNAPIAIFMSLFFGMGALALGFIVLNAPGIKDMIIGVTFSLLSGWLSLLGIRQLYKKPKICLFKDYFVIETAFKSLEIQYLNIAELRQIYRPKAGAALQVLTRNGVGSTEIVAAILRNDAGIYEIEKELRARCSMPELLKVEQQGPSTSFSVSGGSNRRALVFSAAVLSLPILIAIWSGNLSASGAEMVGATVVGGLAIYVLLRGVSDAERLKRENAELFRSETYVKYSQLATGSMVGSLLLAMPILIWSTKTLKGQGFETGDIYFRLFGALFVLSAISYHFLFRKYRKFGSAFTHIVLIAILGVFVSMPLSFGLLTLDGLMSKGPLEGYTFTERCNEGYVYPCYQALPVNEGKGTPTSCINLSGNCALGDLSLRIGWLASRIMSCSKVTKTSVCE